LPGLPRPAGLSAPPLAGPAASSPSTARSPPPRAPPPTSAPQPRSAHAYPMTPPTDAGDSTSRPPKDLDRNHTQARRVRLDGCGVRVRRHLAAGLVGCAVLEDEARDRRLPDVGPDADRRRDGGADRRPSERRAHGARPGRLRPAGRGRVVRPALSPPPGANPR